MKKWPDYIRIMSFTLKLAIGGFTACLMFEHGKQVWGIVLVTAMLIVLFFEFFTWRSKK